jgi:hypothetical protein
MGRQEIFGYDKAGLINPVKAKSGAFHTIDAGGYNYVVTIGSNDTTAVTGLTIDDGGDGVFHAINISTSSAAGSVVIISDPDNAGSVVLANIAIATTTAPKTVVYDLPYVSGLWMEHTNAVAGHFTVTYL